MWLLERVPLWFRSLCLLGCDAIEADSKDPMEEFTGPSPELAQKLYDTRRNLRESIIFYPLEVSQEAHEGFPEYRRVFTEVEEFDKMLKTWERIGLIVPDITPKETATALKKAVKF